VALVLKLSSGATHALSKTERIEPGFRRSFMQDVLTAQVDHFGEAHPPANEDCPTISPADPAIGLNVLVVDFLSGYTVRGVLESFTPGEVTIQVEEMIPEQRSATVQFGSFVFQGETLYCRAKGARYEAHITIGASENGMRKWPRFPIKLAGQVFPPESGPVAITIVDVSRDGLGLELPMFVEPGRPIAIAAGNVFVFATVCYCRPLSDGVFRAGVEIEHVLEKPCLPDPTDLSTGMMSRVFRRRIPPKTTL
jgi:hypothetical protein